MSVRQYIGARYVPKFYEFNNGVWQINTEYEPLTIVQYNGNSYTSKKSVPADIGNPSENPIYWVSTGNYNAQVESYRQEVSALSKKVNRNIRIIGDSYGTTNGSGELEITPYPVLLQGYLGLDNNHYKTAHRNGAGFANGEFISLLNTFNDDDTVTELYVFGGWNDIASRYSSESVIANMISFANLARQKFPNAKLYLGLLAYAYMLSDNSMFDLIELDRWAYGQCARWCGMNYLKTSGIAVQSVTDFWVNVNTAQGCSHPSDIGSLYIANRLCNVINLKNPTFNYRTVDNMIGVNGITISQGFICQTNNGYVINTYLSERIDFNKSDGITINAAWGLLPTQIGKVTECCSGGTQNKMTFRGTIRYKTTAQESDWLKSDVQILISQGNISIKSLSENLINVTEGYIELTGTTSFNSLYN